MSKTDRTVLVPAGLYRAVKYTIYLLLAVNIGMFLREEWAAAAHTLTPGLRGFISAFAQTIDTAAWVVLLLLFELETFVIPDRLLTTRLRRTLHGIRALCYLCIVYAFVGYWTVAFDLYAAVPASWASLCDALDGGVSYLAATGDYVAVTATNCAGLSRAPLWQVGPEADRVLSDAAALDAARRLAWTDVINAGDWLLVVLLLEADVRLQLAGHLHGRVLRASEWTKGFLYAALLACAVYWGYAGTFLDFWDAFLWLLAFVLIEMNVLEWQAETKDTGS
jgi:hypothetical protein